MENQQVLDVISNLKGRKNYEDKKSKKLGFNSLYEYIEDKLAKKEESLYNEFKARQAFDSLDKAIDRMKGSSSVAKPE